ncbi:MAG: hypothetical protein N3E52_05880 [Candidatus Bathyarchaeota archaeon]|nr:hypothetical protein [Candidatus Bathyarchaeota archaeon]
MFRNNVGKLLVYTPTDAASRKRLKFIQTAAEETAKLLNLEFEVVKFRQILSPIYVYYESSDGEPVPLYCDNGKTDDLQEIRSTIRKMMFVLSFHPRHSALKHLRETIMRLS